MTGLCLITAFPCSILISIQWQPHAAGWRIWDSNLLNKYLEGHNFLAWSSFRAIWQNFTLAFPFLCFTATTWSRKICVFGLGSFAANTNHRCILRLSILTTEIVADYFIFLEFFFQMTKNAKEFHFKMDAMIKLEVPHSKACLCPSMHEPSQAT